MKISTHQTNQFVDSVEATLAELMEEEYRFGEGILGEAGEHLAMAERAKRARPRLAHHVGRLVGADETALLDVAVAAELVHNASLLHDDVADEGEKRRGKPTVNTRWNNATAVLTGDLFLCRALDVLRDRAPELTTTALGVVTEMARGMMRELGARREIGLSREAWSSIALAKTGSLMGWCGRAPGLLAATPAEAKRFDTCGRQLGLAFQLADDLKDLASGDFGKDELADLHNGHLSFPLICAVDESEAVRERIDSFWNDTESSPRPGEIREAVLATSALEETREAIRRAVESALDALADQGTEPGGREVVFWAKQLLNSV